MMLSFHHPSLHLYWFGTSIWRKPRCSSCLSVEQFQSTTGHSKPYGLKPNPAQCNVVRFHQSLWSSLMHWRKRKFIVTLKTLPRTSVGQTCLSLTGQNVNPCEILIVQRCFEHEVLCSKTRPSEKCPVANTTAISPPSENLEQNGDITVTLFPLKRPLDANETRATHWNASLLPHLRVKVALQSSRQISLSWRRYVRQLNE